MQPLKNFPAFYETRRFNTVITRAIHLPYPEPYTSHTIPSYLSKIHFNFVPRTKSHVRILPLRTFTQGIGPGPRLLVYFRNRLIFYGESLLAPRPTPKLEDHSLSAVRYCLFNIFTAAFHNWRAFPPSATR
jgi:hypothetical protein